MMCVCSQERLREAAEAELRAKQLEQEVQVCACMLPVCACMLGVCMHAGVVCIAGPHAECGATNSP